MAGVLDRRTKSTIPTFLVVAATVSLTFAADGGATYLLVTNEELAPAFQSLVDRRTSQGFPGKLVTVESIYANYQGVDAQEKIKNCVKENYLNHGTLYVALGGDDVIVPVRYCHPTDDNSIVDLYYSDMDGGSWDLDGNGLYGELQDVNEVELTPEVHLGRIPVRTFEDAEVYVNKVVIYETAPPDDFANSMLCFNADRRHVRQYSGNARPDDFRDHDPVAAVELTMKRMYFNLIQPYWQAVPFHFLFDTNSSWDVEKCGDHGFSRDRLVEHLNRGYHFLLYVGHAGPTHWSMGSGVGFGAEHAMNLTNYDRPSVIFSHGCGPAGFDRAEPCLSEAFLRNPNGGAVVFFAYIRSPGHKTHLDRLITEIFKYGHTVLGEAISNCLTFLAPTRVGNAGAVYEHYAFTLHGDPCIQLLGEENGRHLQIFQPKGCEVIQQGDDVYIRWSAAGTDFAADEKVKLEYSPDGGLSWEGIPGAEQLPCNGRLFNWEACPLPVGSEYRVRVTSLTDPSVNHTSGRNFTIAELGLLTVKSIPIKDVILSGSHANVTDYNIGVLPGATVTLTAPDMPPLDFIRWYDADGNTLCNQQEYTFTFVSDKTIVAQYEYAGPVVEYYVNDEIAENGVAVGSDHKDGLTAQTPKRHIQAILDEYPDIGWGAIINVSAGIYEENINLSEANTGLELRGAGQELTIVDGLENGSCFRLDDLAFLTIADLAITNGSARYGGGIYCDNSSPTISRCVFSDNKASEWGGGLHSRGGCSYPRIIDCTFTRNHSEGKGGAVHVIGTMPEFIRCVFTSNWSAKEGGATSIEVDSKIIDCVFTGNHSDNKGGAVNGRGVECVRCVFTSNSSARDGGALNAARSKIINCVFTGNTAGGFGGGAICNRGSWAQLIASCVFRQNHSNANGGAILNIGKSSPTILNCLFFENSANNGGGIADESKLSVILTNCTFNRNSARDNGGGIYVKGSSVVAVNNCILWDNMAQSGPELYVKTNLTTSCTDVKDGQAGISLGPDAVLTWGDGNIDADPLFADPDNEDYHLKSQAKRWDVNSRSWVQDGVTSPCIDAGDPNSDWTAELWPHGKRINMGAYGGTAQASMSQCDQEGNPADFNNDDTIDMKDFVILAAEWTTDEALLAEDINRDGHVNFPDFAEFTDNWLSGIAP